MTYSKLHERLLRIQQMEGKCSALTIIPFLEAVGCEHKSLNAHILPLQVYSIWLKYTVSR